MAKSQAKIRGVGEGRGVGVQFRGEAWVMHTKREDDGLHLYSKFQCV